MFCLHAQVKFICILVFAKITLFSSPVYFCQVIKFAFNFCFRRLLVNGAVWTCRGHTGRTENRYVTDLLFVNACENHSAPLHLEFTTLPQSCTPSAQQGVAGGPHRVKCCKPRTCAEKKLRAVNFFSARVANQNILFFK